MTAEQREQVIAAVFSALFFTRIDHQQSQAGRPGEGATNRLKQRFGDAEPAAK